ncbi:hypothetical protein [Pseudooceanicola aestuarii]|uniref:hypothetical protein n=1 Tax=Pseudooceanicola aestuarii TaxID=2697319 RepID=UPI0013CF4A76|nr:hypothetical protein [Pseudooceanicola aestuarii]
MTRSAFSVIPALCAVLLILVTSSVSAWFMAPDRAEQAKFVTAVTFALSPADFCGDPSGHDHRCPFCHSLPEPPAAQAPDVMALLRPADGWRRLADLHRAAQARDLSHAPRAPPVPA